MTLRTIWLTFAQAATVALAALFVVTTLKPEWFQASREAAAPGPVVVSQTAPSSPYSVKPSSYSEAVRRAAPAVVNVNTTKEVKVPERHPFMDDPVFRRYFGDMLESESRKARGLGSGVVVSPSGYILTNNHVIEATDEIEVSLADGRNLPARIVGADPETDLAVLKVEAKELPSITFGQLASVQVGDVVLAIGNPFGVGQTVTMGIVSALGRTGLGINTFENFIQTDAAINTGNSGGALIDAAGNLIGINTAILSRTGGSIGIGFAIPASTAQKVMEDIIATGSVTRGFIGVEAQEVTAEVAAAAKLSSAAGALIAGVVPNGPADQAGVKPGDVLVRIEDKPVADPTAMLNAVAELKPGERATMRLVRQGKEIDLQLTVGKRPPVRRPR